MIITDEQLAELQDYGTKGPSASRRAALAAVEEIEYLRQRLTDAEIYRDKYHGALQRSNRSAERRGRSRDVLRKIIKKAKSPTWWARLSYPQGEWWTEEERKELESIT